MVFYKLHHYDAVDGSFGFTWYPNKKAAQTALADCCDTENKECEIERVELSKLRKTDLLWLLNTHASHPDNG